MLNPPVKPGDKIKLYSMEDETSIPPGTRGEVISVERDPFSGNKENVIISVNWENGSKLSLLSSLDFWKKIEEQKISESSIDRNYDPYMHFLVENKDLRKSFDLNFFNEYFNKLRDSGIVNMYGASPFAYVDSTHLERYYGEGREDNEDFQELLDIQDEAKEKFISGLVKYARLKDLDIDIDRNINSLAKRLSQKILEFYMLFYDK